jgi:hypothetical protein
MKGASRLGVLFLLAVSSLGQATTRLVPDNYPTIQDAVDASLDGDIIILAPGAYKGNGNRDIDFHGNAITLKSRGNARTCVIDCQGSELDPHRGFYFHSAGDANSTIEGVSIIGGYAELGGAIYSYYANLRIVGCIISGNKAVSGGAIHAVRSNLSIGHSILSLNDASNRGGGINCGGEVVNITNCTITGNYAKESGGGIALGAGEKASISSTILWGNSAGVGAQIFRDGCLSPAGCMEVIVRYSCIEPGHDSAIEKPWGRPIEGIFQSNHNISDDPLFATNNGNQDSSDVRNDPEQDTALDRDYHLKSRTGRWDPNSQSWVKDNVTSPCIDAGDPNSPVGEEPIPNGGRINMGAYGGTAEASKSYFSEPVCETIIPGDINGDCKVNFCDLAILAMRWLEDRTAHRIVTTTYRLVEEKSSVVSYCGRGGTRKYAIAGTFALTIDFTAGTAVFERVDVTSDNTMSFIDYGKEGEPIYTNELSRMFHMTQVISSEVNDVEATFAFHKNIPSFPGADIHMTVGFKGDSVSIAGRFSDPVADGCWHDLNAVAVPVRDP